MAGPAVKWIVAAIIVMSVGANVLIYKLFTQERQENETLRVMTVQMEQLKKEADDAVKLRLIAQEVESLRENQSELMQLRGEVGGLRSQRETIQKLEAENQRLAKLLKDSREKLANQSLDVRDRIAVGVRSEMLARERAAACMANLKQIGLAVRIHASENNGTFPTTITEILDELADQATLETLVCPSHTGREAAADWDQVTASTISYSYTFPATPPSEVDQLVLTRCPVHPHQGLGDGSVEVVGVEGGE